MGVQNDVTEAEFAKILLNAVDETLSSLGNSIKKSIYLHLSKEFGINQSEIPNKIPEFAIAIENLLGRGALYLEIQIMKRLCTQMGTIVEWQEPSESALPYYVAKAKTNFLSCTKREENIIASFESNDEPQIRET